MTTPGLGGLGGSGAGAIPLTQRAVASGVATLDATTHVPAAQIPDLSPTYAPVDATDETTVLYVKPTGNDASSGLSWKKALQTLQAAITALPITGGVIQLSGGNFQLTGAVTLAGRTNVTIKGAGSNATQIIVNGNYNAIALTGVCSGITIKDLWIGSFAARTAGWGVTIVGTAGAYADRVTLDNVVIQNTYGGILNQYLANGRFNNVRVIASIAGGLTSLGWNIISSVSCRLDNCVIQALGVTTGTDGLRIDSDCDTILVTGTEIVGSGGGHFGGRGIYLLNSLGGASTGPRLCRITNSFVENANLQGILVSSARELRIQGCSIAMNSDSGVQLSGGQTLNITDTTVLSNGAYGINLAGGTGVVVRGCTTSNNGTAAAYYDGILVGANVTHVIVAGNRCGDVIFPATPSQSYGIEVSATETDYLLIQGNELTGNVNGGIINSSTGTHNSISGNLP